MPRPQKLRSVQHPPQRSRFKPTGVRARFLETAALTLDEFEAVRLADYLGLDHEKSARRMEISRSTFSRLVERARRKVAEFLVEGKQLQIGGGEIHFQGNLIRCEDCGNVTSTALDTDTTGCPACGSTNLADLADGFGHGRCCHLIAQDNFPGSRANE